MHQRAITALLDSGPSRLRPLLLTRFAALLTALVFAAIVAIAFGAPAADAQAARSITITYEDPAEPDTPGGFMYSGPDSQYVTVLLTDGQSETISYNVGEYFDVMVGFVGIGNFARFTCEGDTGLLELYHGLNGPMPDGDLNCIMAVDRSSTLTIVTAAPSNPERPFRYSIVSAFGFGDVELVDGESVTLAIAPYDPSEGPAMIDGRNILGWSTEISCDSLNVDVPGFISEVDLKIPAGEHVTCEFTHAPVGTADLAIAFESPENESAQFKIYDKEGQGYITLGHNEFAFAETSALADIELTNPSVQPAHLDLVGSCEGDDGLLVADENGIRGELEAGANVVCTYTATGENIPRSTLTLTIDDPEEPSTVHKLRLPSTEQEFSLAHGETGSLEFKPGDDVNIVPGYRQRSAFTEVNCIGNDGSLRVGSGGIVGVMPSGDVDCTLSVDRSTSITFVTVAPDDPDQTFRYWVSGYPSLDAGLYTVDGDVVNVAVVPGESLDILSLGADGWTTDIDCTNPDQLVLPDARWDIDATLSAGTRATCTFTHTYTSATRLTIVVDDPTAPEASHVFRFINGPAPIVLSHGSSATVALPPGEVFNVRAALVPTNPYAGVECDAGGSEIDIETVGVVVRGIAVPADVTCTWTTDRSSDPTLTLAVDDPEGPGLSHEVFFGSSSNSYDITHGQPVSIPVQAGAELSVYQGYDMSSMFSAVSCVGDNGSLGTADVRITGAMPDADVTCTFVVDRSTSINLVTVAPEDPTKEFDYWVGRGSVEGKDGGVWNFAVRPGENFDSILSHEDLGWTTDISCTDPDELIIDGAFWDVDIKLNKGTQATCTFTHRRVGEATINIEFESPDVPSILRMVTPDETIQLASGDMRSFTLSATELEFGEALVYPAGSTFPGCGCQPRPEPLPSVALEGTCVGDVSLLAVGGGGISGRLLADSVVTCTLVASVKRMWTIFVGVRRNR